MALSAADLQQAHAPKHRDLEGAPDPFPTLGGATPAALVARKVQPAAPTTVDTSSQDAFPSLGASSAPSKVTTKPAVSMWASKPSAVKTGNKPMAPGGLGRTGTPTAGSHPFAETFSIPTAELLQGNAASDTVKKVRDVTGAIIEASTAMRTGLKTFHIKAADQKKLSQAKKMIESGLRKPITIQVEVPITTLGTIIGPKGATLKGITDSAGVKIDVPRRESLPAYTPKDDDDEEEEEPQVAITVTGPGSGCAEAKEKINALISHKVSQTSTSIKTIPAAFFTVISAKATELEQGPGEGKVTVTVPTPAVWKALERQAQPDAEDEKVETEGEAPIKVKGDREAVKAVVDEINKFYETVAASFNLKRVSIPKRQHRFLIGSAAEGILAQTECIVELPPVDDASDRVVIRGPQAKLVAAQSLIFEKANAVSVEPVDLVSLFRRSSSDSLTHATNVLRYLRASKLRSISNAHSNVQIFPPFPSAVANSGTVIIEVVGEDGEEVAKTVDEIEELAKSVSPAGISTVQVDYLAHGLLTGKRGAKIASFEKAHGVSVVFPPASEESSNVLLVFSGPSSSLPKDAAGKDAHLAKVFESASKDLVELAKEVADIKTEVLEVERKLHKYVIGQGGSVLNAIIGEDGLVSVKVGASGKFPSTGKEDSIIIRGPRNEVDRVTEKIKQVVEDGRNDAIVNGYTVQFDVDKKHVPHLVGQAGATINKLRETLGVKVNFDDAPEKEIKKGAKKQIINVSIVGRKEPAEEAKKRLLAQIEKLEDETTETVIIKRAIQPALIGAGGKYAIRLEEKYGVKLSFPREAKETGGNPDHVTIRGGKKGVAAVKAELLEAAAFESESRQETTFKVPSKAVAQIVGKGGATINAIKNDSGAQIDIEKEGGGDKQTTITVRGDKAAIAAAKEAVMKVVEEVGDEITVELTIDPKYHRNLIGQGGQKLRETVAACDGPTEGYKQAGLVTFPRAGDETTDKVRLRGQSKLVKKLQAELEKQVAVLKETIVIGVVVPAAQHASKIGRGGSALQDLQRKTGAAVHFPGSRQYASLGEVENKADLEDAAEGDIVKVMGTKSVCEKAAELLKVFVERPQRDGSRQGRSNPDLQSRSVSIPNKYYHAIAEQPDLIHQIRSAGGFLSIPQPAPPKPAAKGPQSQGEDVAAKAARIDVDGDEDVPEVQGHWVLEANYRDEDDTESEWAVRAKDDDVEKVVKVLEKAVEKAKQATYIGYLTGLPRSAFPRIIGGKGATITRLRLDTGADIQVGKQDDLITITGDEESVLQAKDAILAIVSRPSRERY